MCICYKRTCTVPSSEAQPPAAHPTHTLPPWNTDKIQKHQLLGPQTTTSCVLDGQNLTFSAFSSSLTVMFPVPGPTSNTTSVGLRAAFRHKYKTDRFNNSTTINKPNLRSAELNLTLLHCAIVIAEAINFCWIPC